MLGPLPTSLIKELIDIFVILIIKIINKSLSTGIFPDVWKIWFVTPLVKKHGLDTILSN